MQYVQGNNPLNFSNAYGKGHMSERSFIDLKEVKIHPAYFVSSYIIRNYNREKVYKVYKSIYAQIYAHTIG